MTDNVRRRPGQTKQLLERLKELLLALPSESEKREAEAQFTSLIQFLKDLQDNLRELPDRESTGEIREGVQRLEDFFSRAEADPNLAAVLGLRRATKKKQGPLPATPQELTVARGAIDRLQALPLDESRSKLQNESLYPLTVLRAIAASLRIRSGPKLSRESLVHQIAMKLANLRGYEHLRNRGEESLGRGGTEESTEAPESQSDLPPTNSPS
jgi:hypothetical protein